MADEIRKVGIELFQFPPPRRGRPDSGIYFSPQSYFNSRPRVGGDINQEGVFYSELISIPAPA